MINSAASPVWSSPKHKWPKHPMQWSPMWWQRNVHAMLDAQFRPNKLLTVHWIARWQCQSKSVPPAIGQASGLCPHDLTSPSYPMIWPTTYLSCTMSSCDHIYPTRSYTADHQPDMKSHLSMLNIKENTKRKKRKKNTLKKVDWKSLELNLQFWTIFSISKAGVVEQFHSFDGPISSRIEQKLDVPSPIKGWPQTRAKNRDKFHSMPHSSV